MTGRQLCHEWIGQARQGIVDRIANVTMVDTDAVGGRDQFDDLSGVECPVHRTQRPRAWGSPFDHGLSYLAQGVTHGADMFNIPGRESRLGCRSRSRSVRAIAVNDLAFDEPGQRVLEVREPLNREAVIDVGGVEEVEGRPEVDAVGMTSTDPGMRFWQHGDNQNITVDRLHARGYGITSSSR